MVNLEKVRDLLKKGVENPLFQDAEGNFSAEKWKKEVKEYTEPFLSSITDQLNESLTQEKDFWRGNEFKILSKSLGKKTSILSLQDAGCKLSKPFGFKIGDGKLRLINAVIVLSPSESSVEENYRNCVLWGLRWWGTTEKSKTAYARFDLMNKNSAFTVSRAKDMALGGTYTWMFNSVTAKELVERGLESIAETITNDFLQLSSILSKNEGLFSLSEDRPRREDVEKAVLSIWSKTGQTQINKSDVLETIEPALKEEGITLEAGWRKIIEGKLWGWFG